jgi:hypothetical protein
MVNLTGGYDQGLSATIANYDRAFPARFYTFTETHPKCAAQQCGYPDLQVQASEQAARCAWPKNS